jgi:hypothetical protein
LAEVGMVRVTLKFRSPRSVCFFSLAINRVFSVGSSKIT